MVWADGSAVATYKTRTIPIDNILNIKTGMINAH